MPSPSVSRFGGQAASSETDRVTGQRDGVMDPMDEYVAPSPQEALIVVDVQNDFCPGGALGVRDGDAVVPVLNGLIGRFRHVALTCDWHPVDHCSFAARGGPWPPHCVQGTAGAAFHPALRTEGATVFRKGAERDAEAYSGFAGRSDAGEDLAGWLRARGVTRVWIGGLATDYCVRATALDALRAGFEATVVADGCRAVDVRPGDGERALAELRAAGAQIRSAG
jgi:nicotinamidase/pyrazinamidase